MKTQIAVFASGNGSNFEAIARGCEEGRINAEVALVVTDRPGAYVVERAKRHNVPVVEFRPKDYASKAEFETMLLEKLTEKGVELICLAGYMRIIGDVLLNAYGDGSSISTPRCYRLSAARMPLGKHWIME